MYSPVYSIFLFCYYPWKDKLLSGTKKIVMQSEIVLCFADVCILVVMTILTSSTNLQVLYTQALQAPD